MFHSQLNTLIIVITSYILYILYLVVYGYLDFGDSYGTFPILIKLPGFYLVLFFLSFAMMLLELAINFIYINLMSLPHNLIRIFVSVRKNI